MPRFDGTGPNGDGPMTGRGFGPCACGMGLNCCGCRYRRFVSPKNELVALEEEERALERELAVIREEKAALEKNS